MKILVDENIPFGREAFSTLGEVETCPGRRMTADAVKDADALIVRSVTRVDEGLLAGSGVSFVASATIGLDHIDGAYLAQRKIGFASAQGSNANSVAEYVAAALLVLRRRNGIVLGESSIGVVGVGSVGSLVAKKADALGMKVVRNDPPLARETGEIQYRPLAEALACDFVTFHVPLTYDGPDATYHLLNGALLDRLSPGSFVINTSRGAVADTAALLAALRARKIAGAVLDVWENEPGISTDLLAVCDLATPHIAGYSFDGKVNGTQMVYDAACEFFGLPARWKPASDMPDPEYAALPYDATGLYPEDAVDDIVSMLYNIEEDDCSLRAVLEMEAEGRAPYFDTLRKDYRRRREFQNTLVTLSNAPADVADALWGLGFKTKKA